MADRHAQLLVRQRLLLARAASILGTELPPIRRPWDGVYSQPLKGALFHRQQVGETPWVVTGAGGRGMTLAPAIAEAVPAELGL